MTLSVIVDSAVGQIPRSTERISSLEYTKQIQTNTRLRGLINVFMPKFRRKK